MSRLGWAVCLAAATLAAKADQQPPVIRHTPCGSYRPGVPFEIVVEIEDESELFDPKVLYRSPPTSRWRTLTLSADPDGVLYRAVVPATHLVGPLQYAIEAFDINGNGPAQNGTIDRPHEALPNPAATSCGAEPIPLMAPSAAVGAAAVTGPPPPPPVVPPSTAAELSSPPPPAAPGWCGGAEPPFYCEPWVWGVWGGVVVAAAVVTGVVLAKGSGDQPPESVSLEISGPAPTEHR